MGIRDLIKKKDQLGGGVGGAVDRETLDRLAGPEFTFIRSDTHTQEIIHAPSDPRDPHAGGGGFLSAGAPSSNSSTPSKARRSLDVFKPRSRGSSLSSAHPDGEGGGGNTSSNGGARRRLSQRLHLSKAPQTSDFVPENLPQISVYAAEKTTGAGGRAGTRAGAGTAPIDRDAYEGQWEKRATILAAANERGQRSRSPSVAGSATPSPSAELPGLQLHPPDDPIGARTRTTTTKADGAVSSKAIDDQIQEAIRLHEAGQLDQSTRLFGILADPNAANNPLSQVLYGLALRHGWGCEPDPERAVTYLSAAASNAAAVESMALQAGLKKGGAAKGELVLAIFELANCFRHGWGIPRDPVAAKQVGIVSLFS
ncbi:HCP-like protein [Hypoxylon sp. FL1284]|nr:HCP-like protein [Hypoxylon sp. FL1284]